ncbi:unnamed protein product, partial [Ectocarpus sp. 12 AP-2014]
SGSWAWWNSTRVSWKSGGVPSTPKISTAASGTSTRRSTSIHESPVDSREVLTLIDPELVRHFNGSLALQWEVYERAVGLWGIRCREVLPDTLHEDMCTVPPPLVVIEQ